MFAVAATRHGAVIILFYLAIVVFEMVALWRVFTKAGQPGWGIFIPIYNAYLFCRIAGRSGWWTVLLLIPFINIITTLILMLDVANAFSRTVAFGLGLWILSPIFIPILAFGESEYNEATSFTSS